MFRRKMFYVFPVLFVGLIVWDVVKVSTLNALSVFFLVELLPCIFFSLSLALLVVKLEKGEVWHDILIFGGAFGYTCLNYLFVRLLLTPNTLIGIINNTKQLVESTGLIITNVSVHFNLLSFLIMGVLAALFTYLAEKMLKQMA